MEKISSSNGIEEYIQECKEIIGLQCRINGNTFVGDEGAKPYHIKRTVRHFLINIINKRNPEHFQRLNDAMLKKYPKSCVKAWRGIKIYTTKYEEDHTTQCGETIFKVIKRCEISFSPFRDLLSKNGYSQEMIQKINECYSSVIKYSKEVHLKNRRSWIVSEEKPYLSSSYLKLANENEQNSQNIFNENLNLHNDQKKEELSCSTSISNLNHQTNITLNESLLPVGFSEDWNNATDLQKKKQVFRDYLIKVVFKNEREKVLYMMKLINKFFNKKDKTDILQGDGSQFKPPISKFIRKNSNITKDDLT